MKVFRIFSNQFKAINYIMPFKLSVNFIQMQYIVCANISLDLDCRGMLFQNYIILIFINFKIKILIKTNLLRIHFIIY